VTDYPIWLNILIGFALFIMWVQAVNLLSKAADLFVARKLEAEANARAANAEAAALEGGSSPDFSLN
jgi:hypothetical protein